MALDLSRTLVVGISSTALFDLSAEDHAFRDAEAQDKDAAIVEYRKKMREAEGKPLKPGPGMPVVEALLRLNKHTPNGEPPIVEVVVMSRNSPETGLRLLNSIRSREMQITRSVFTGGEPVAPLLKAFSVDLFLTTNAKDAQAAIDQRACAAATLTGRQAKPAPDERVRIAFDGDAVLFDDASEFIYKSKGIGAFHANEAEHRDDPLGRGPYAALLNKLSSMQERLPMRIEYSPVRISIVTARNAPSDLRVINTLRSWGVYVDEAYFLGGLPKAPVLEAINPHIFFDDQDMHLLAAAEVVPSGKVPYRSDSMMGSLQVTREDDAKSMNKQNGDEPQA
jgi:5'-nucleotidase